MSPSLYFWIASASRFVIPLPFPFTSPLALPCAVIWSGSFPLMPNLLGFAIDCMISTASATDTTSSQFASPARVTAIPVSVVVVLSVGSEVEEVVVVVSEDVVVAVVVVVVVSVSGVFTTAESSVREKICKRRVPVDSDLVCGIAFGIINKALCSGKTVAVSLSSAVFEVLVNTACEHTLHSMADSH